MISRSCNLWSSALNFSLAEKGTFLAGRTTGWEARLVDEPFILIQAKGFIAVVLQLENILSFFNYISFSINRPFNTESKYQQEVVSRPFQEHQPTRLVITTEV